jgi:hypothetical protein
MAAFLAKLPWLTADEADRVEAWGSARYKDFRVVDSPYPETDEPPFCTVGGLFRAPPRSQAHLRRLMGNNLTNWGVQRPSYEHGWLRLVSRDEAREQLGLKAEAAKECEQVVQVILDNVWAEVAANAAKKLAEQQARREKACRLLWGLVAPRRSLEIGFEALAATTSDQRDERAAKTARWNLERFGLAGDYVGYSPAELRECSDWAAVKRRRLSEPDPRRDRQDTLCSNAALEKAAQLSVPALR